MRKRTTHKLNRVIGALGIGLVAGGLLLGGQLGTTPAQAVNLPTWDDVQAAKGNEAAAAAKVTEIEKLIKSGEKELERLRTESADANQSWQTAEAAAQAAAEKAATLETQAEESRAKADEAADQAAVIVAQMYRSGGVDRNMELFLQTEGDTADALLERLASMSKATERNTTISQEAEQAMNTASTLGKQAEAAQQERDRLSAEAEEKAKTAAQAADTKRIEIEAQEDQQKTLETQLAALKDKTTDTVAGYQERLRVEEEQRRAAAAAEAERLRKEAEANANAGGGGGGYVPPSSGGGGGYVPPPSGGGGNDGSWWRPTSGWVSTYYYQVPYHSGVDLATGCGTPIIAPRAGTVSFVGWKDNIGGNMVHVEHDGGFQTRYAHLGAFGPGWGTYVGQGGVVGYVGTTGMSTGCHLHYEVLINGSFVNPIPNYGVTG
ncbi:peptidoglycan DD-metalloendopeptidase family protein [Leucobacter insecticola]|uniref:Peptidoglycan DD-metalloendopeptidase family protein n=1 Tax=Leucobacter insecticola TaxID=2714934 RepID=A0A6G8FLC0_9MICO|nr:M23 family metallopeptidase [Leucobacter insecticola]QIM17226.1 peptidoglycan DD-metalloendopeptidase family protein [Leucobacter insecticola]